MQRASEFAGFGELGVELRGNFERVGHIGIAVGLVGHAAAVMLVETPLFQMRGPQIQRGEGVDALRTRDEFRRAEDAFRTFDARTVVGFDAREVESHDLGRRDFLREDRLLNVGDRCFFDLKCGLGGNARDEGDGKERAQETRPQAGGWTRSRDHG